MALTSTIYNATVELSDVDRGVYETLDLRLAMHPSESPAYFATRLLAYCLEYTEGIELSAGGLSNPDEPAIVVRDLTGRVTAWIEVGAPDADRLHRGSKLAGRVVIYTHRNIRQVLGELAGKKIHGAENIPIYAFDAGFIESVTAVLDRREDVALSVTERQLYLDVSGKTFHTAIAEHRLT